MERQNTTKGFAILSAASFICKLLAFVYLPVQTMLVQDTGNGVISAGFKLYCFILGLTYAGLPVIISKFVSESVELGDFNGSKVVFRSSFSLMLLFGTSAALFTYFGAGFLADWCGMAEAELMFKFFAPTFLFTSVSCSLRGYFQGRHNMTPTAISQVVEQLINSLMTVGFEILFFNYAMRNSLDVISYVAAGSAAATALAAAGSAVFLGFLFLVVHRKRRMEEYATQTYSGTGLKTLSVYMLILKFSIPALVSAIAVSAIDIVDTRSCVALLTKNFTMQEAYALFGIYSTKFQRLLTLPAIFVTPLVTAMLPALAAARSRGDHQYFADKIRESFRLNYIVVMPIVAGMTFLSKPILTVIFASQNAGSLMVILFSWTAVLNTVQSIQTGVLIALDKPLVPPLTMILGVLAKVICNYVLIPIPEINIYGAVIGGALAFIVSMILNQYYINKHMKVKQQSWRHMIKPTVASAAMGLASLIFYSILFFLLKGFSSNFVLVNDIAMLITIPFGAFVYFVVLALTGIIKAEDIIKLPMGEKLNRLIMKVPFLSRILIR
jgi:stage V sporulation protein B